MTPCEVLVSEGLLNWATADEARAIKGHHTSEIADILGAPGRATLIHRDDMVL